MQPTRETAILTVANVRRPRRGVTEVRFNEREQIFRLPAASARELAARLDAGRRSREPLKAALNPRRATLQRLLPLSPREREEFERTRTYLDEPARPVRIRVRDIDPTIFNIVDRHLKFPAFRLCRRIIPNYKQAKKVFDFCAKQSCHLPGPPTVSPCIPFQYVIDGCYARAHQMRKIITERFGYCCEKVFSFANQNNDDLAVRADKWGGCCVYWWYHVAPLVRVRFRFGRFSLVLALVIDPSMFDKPVLLSTWLMAQENTGCASNANVSMYSIQPGSAYTPANFSGTAFSTDPSYTSTNATLIAYKNLTTCP